MDTLVVILLSFSLASGYDYQSRCLLFNKTCVPFCPRLMHPYHMRCDVESMSQRTCDALETYPIGYTCGWSRCDCNGDLTLDEQSYHCVDQEECPVLKKRRYRPGRRHLRGGLPKKIKISSDTDDLIDMKR